ncbi:MAG: hypothetical protein COW65_14895 [Cytophagales bacterium CG18_big_fil_WC_8_21_14_2_50_42_9]|nr:MAG: hypothetical protein COW65_14895 [Cytophagales bacterium CG18_big_fil_WC_8_21_14_2_50_42_9]
MGKYLQRIKLRVEKGLTGILLLIVLIQLSSTAASAQDKYFYRSKEVFPLDWSGEETWERSLAVDGVYEPTSIPPLIENSINVLISNLSEVTISTSVDIDQLVVNGTLIISDIGVLNILNNSELEEPNLIIPGLLVNNGTLAIVDETASVEVTGALYNTYNIEGATASNFTFKAGSTYDHQITITSLPVPDATWNESSTIKITGLTSGSSTTYTNLDQEFGNFIWDTPNMGGTASSAITLTGLLNIKGDFTIKSTGSSSRPLFISTNLTVDGNLLTEGPGILRLSTGGNRTVTVNGNIEVTGGTLDLNFGSSGTTNLNVLGDLKYTAGSITKSTGSTANINFSGTNNQSATINKNFSGAINFSVATGSVLDLGETSFIGTTIPATSTFTVQTGGTVKIGDADGINTSTGNIKTPQTYANNSTIVFEGTAAQVLGTDFPATAINVEVDNTAGVTMDRDLTLAVSRTLTLTAGSLNIGANTLTLGGTVTGPGTLGTVLASNLVINGSGPLGTLNFSSESIGLNNFTLNRLDDGTATLGDDIAVLGQLNLNNGTLIVNDRTLGLYGTANYTGGALAGNNETVVAVGVEPYPTSGLPQTGTINLNFSAAGNIVNTLSLGTLATEVNLRSNLNISESLILQEGDLNNTEVEVLTLADNSTAYLTNGTISFAPVDATGGAYNLVYYGATASPGYEFTTDATIRNLTIGDVNNRSEFTTLGEERTLKGNLTVSNGSFSGSISMIGDSPQTIAGDVTIQNLTINNTAGVNINNNINVAGELTFTSGIMSTGGNRVLLGNTGSVSGETDASHLLGNLQISKTLTVGTAEEFGNIGIMMLPSDVNPGEITVNRNTGTPITAAVGTASIARVFDITGPVNGQNIAMTLKYLDAELNENFEGNLRMYKSTNPAIWVEQLEDEEKGKLYNYAVENQVTLTGVEGFSRWTLAAPMQVLPVELTYFTAKKKNKAVELNWETVQEIDNKGFEIQVSGDAGNYRKIGFVSSKSGNSRTAQKYTFPDTEKRTYGGTYYYRLKQVDHNGVEKFYGPQSVTLSAEVLAIKAYPNPFSRTFEAQFAADANKEVTVVVINAMGKEILAMQVQANRGLNSLNIDLGSQPAGMYFLSIISNSGKQQIKLIKK